MPLTEIPLQLDLQALPDEVHDVIDDAERRMDEFHAAGHAKRFPRHVPGDPVTVHAALAFLKEGGHLRGDLFCEWGCGFGTATAIAGLLGFEALGIEIESELAAQAARLAADHQISARILNRSFLPDGYDVSEGMGGVDLLKPGERGGPALYDELDSGEIDVFYVYPWPGEEDFVTELFETIATEDAVLLIYLGEGEIVAYRQEVG